MNCSDDTTSNQTLFLLPSSTDKHTDLEEQELHDSWEFVWEFSQLSCPGQTRTRVAWELMRVDKREFVWEFSQLSCPGQTRTRVAWELMRVDKREFVWEFSQLLCPGQTRIGVSSELYIINPCSCLSRASKLLLTNHS